MNKKIVLILIACSVLLGHGVDHVSTRGGTGIQFRYANGDPLSFSDVQLFRPGETEFEFQIGATDANGVFMFLPDTTGEWSVIVSDGLGHGKVVSIDVSSLSEPAAIQGDLPTWKRIISGLGYLLFAFALWGLFTLKRRT
jgi:hypothetical protein